MSHVLAVKKFPSGLVAELGYASGVEHPRKAADPVSTIAATGDYRYLSDGDIGAVSLDEHLIGLWSNEFSELSDEHGHAQVLEFLDSRIVAAMNTVEYPGVLAGLFAGPFGIVQGDTALHAEPFAGTDYPRGQVGWVYVTPDGLEKHGLSKEQARERIDAELWVLTRYVNGFVFDLAITDPSEPGVVENTGGFYTETFPSDAELDLCLTDSFLTDDDEQALPDTKWVWN